MAKYTGDMYICAPWEGAEGHPIEAVYHFDARGDSGAQGEGRRGGGGHTPFGCWCFFGVAGCWWVFLIGCT